MNSVPHRQALVETCGSGLRHAITFKRVTRAASVEVEGLPKLCIFIGSESLFLSQDVF